MIKITHATHGGDWRIDLEFSSGEIGQVDLAELVRRSGSMVVALRDPKAFGAFFLELGALAWANGFELSPETLSRKARDQGTLRKGRAA
jgi:hypothetical protein